MTPSGHSSPESLRCASCRVWLAQGVFAAVLFVSAAVVPAMGAKSDAGQDTLEKSAQFKERPGYLQLLPVRRDEPLNNNAEAAPQAENQQKAEPPGGALKQDKAETPASKAKDGQARKSVPEEETKKKLLTEEQERKELERRAAREAMAVAKEEAAQAKREAEKLGKEEQERERAAAKEERERRKKDGSAAEKEPQDTRATIQREKQKRPVAATPEQIKELAYKTGLYAYPLVLADAVRQADAQAARQARGVDVFRQFFHSDAVPDIKRAPGVLPQADSLYSVAWLELKNSPYLLDIPAMPDRYYLVQLLDAWTKNLPAISAHDTDGKSGKYIILLRGAQVPADYAAEYTPIFCPTSLCMLLARIQVRTPADVHAAREAQQGLRLTPLCPDKLADRMEASGTAPVRQLAELDAEAFLTRFTGLVADNPASDRDAHMMRQLTGLGIAKGKDAFFSLDEPLRIAAVDGCRRALAGMGIYFNNMSAYHDPMDVGANGWNMSVRDVGTYGERYDMRSHLAAANFGMPRPQDMLQATLRVDANGKFLDGEQNYVLRFEPGQLPPVKGFWSLTLYTATQQLYDNKAQRYALTDSSKLVAEADGSTVIYLQQKTPGGKYQANWLPTPDLGYFSLVLRLYAPGPRALSADWQPPKIMPGKRRTVWD